jgi:hypothetical protein
MSQATPNDRTPVNSSYDDGMMELHKRICTEAERLEAQPERNLAFIYEVGSLAGMTHVLNVLGGWVDADTREYWRAHITTLIVETITAPGPLPMQAVNEVVGVDFLESNAAAGLDFLAAAEAGLALLHNEVNSLLGVMESQAICDCNFVSNVGWQNGVGYALDRLKVWPDEDTRRRYLDRVQAQTARCHTVNVPDLARINT